MDELREGKIAHFKRLIFKNQNIHRLFKHDNGDYRSEALVFLRELQYFCHVERPSYKVSTNGQIDPYATHVAEGRREVWVRIMALLNLDGERVKRELKKLNYQPTEGDEGL